MGDIRNYVPMPCTNLFAPRGAQDEALAVKQDTGGQFSEEDVPVEQGDRAENE